MKKIVIIAVAILFVRMEGCSLFTRDPAEVLPKIVKEEFNVTIEEITPVITDYKEEWSPSGDGFCRIEFKYDGDHSVFFEQFKSLPFNESWEKLPSPAQDFWNLKEGRYLFKAEADDPRDFYILILDTANHTGILYYEFWA